MESDTSRVRLLLDRSFRDEAIHLTTLDDVDYIALEHMTRLSSIPTDDIVGVSPLKVLQQLIFLFVSMWLENPEDAGFHDISRSLEFHNHGQVITWRRESNRIHHRSHGHCFSIRDLPKARQSIIMTLDWNIFLNMSKSSVPVTEANM